MCHIIMSYITSCDNYYCWLVILIILHIYLECIYNGIHAQVMFNIHSINPLVIIIIILQLYILSHKLDNYKYGSYLFFQLLKTISCLRSGFIGHEFF